MSNLIKGSLSDIAKRNNTSLAESFLSCDYLILVDTSGSMMSCDYAEQTRYDRACSELATLQGNLQGKIAVFSFSYKCDFCPNGRPTFPDGSTALHRALAEVYMVDGLIEKLFIISDGEPDDANAALAQAAKFTTPIVTIFIGQSGSAGEAFLKRLATAGNTTLAGARELAATMQVLMLGAGK